MNKKLLKQNKDLILIFLSSLICTFIIKYAVSDMYVVYIEELRTPLLSIFGVFLGCLITSYTVFVALSKEIPLKVRKTKAIKRLNKYFLISMYSLMISVLLIIIFFFTNNTILVLVQIESFLFSMFIVVYLIFVIYKIFNLINNNL